MIRALIDQTTTMPSPAFRRLTGWARLAPLLAALLLSACNDTGPIFATPSALYDWVRAPGSVDPRSDSAPVIADPVVEFRLPRGARRSTLLQGHDWGLAQTYLMGFDIRADRSELGHQTLTLSRFVRTGQPGHRDAVIAAVSISARRGVTVMGRPCIAPADLANWHSVELRIALADDDSGFIEAFCDRKPVVALANLRTTFPPPCRLGAGCTRALPRPPGFEWQLGLISPSRAPRAVRVRMQRIFHHRLFVIPNRVSVQKPKT